LNFSKEGTNEKRNGSQRREQIDVEMVDESKDDEMKLNG